MRLIYTLIFLPLLLLGSTNGYSQLLPPNQPEQDACGALLLCGTSFHTPYSYQGIGHTNDLTGTPCDVPGLSADEDNSMWIRLEIITSGRLIFRIVPVDVQDDYDWAVLNITGGSCDHLSATQVVRCNFNNNEPVANNGITGLDTISNLTSVAAGTTGQPMCRYIDAQAGDVYLIMINNFGHFNNGNPQPSSGFTIDFSGSTAQFFNSDIPHLKDIINPCNITNSLILETTKPILCSSIAPNGSDFLLEGGGSIVSASGINCSGAQGYTSQIQINFTQTLQPGDYVLHARMGTDNNTLMDLCDNELPLPDSLKFKVPILATTENLEICDAQIPYYWNGLLITHGGQGVGTAHFNTSMGCDSVVTLNLSVVDTIKTTQAITICPEALPYTWNGIVVSGPGNPAASFLTQTPSGCDSLTNLNLTVQYPTARTYNLEGCWEVNFNHKTYTASQDDVLDTIISSFGCDSVYATLNVLVHPADTQTFTFNTAGCDSVVYHGKTYFSTITLRDTTKNQFGCDSLYQVTNITVYPNRYVPHSDYITGCDSVVFEGKAYYDDITLMDTFQNVLGCDSAIRITHIHPEHFILSLSADPLHPVNGVNLKLNTGSNVSNYQILSWSPIQFFPDQTALNQNITAPSPGLYTFKAIGLSEAGCRDTAILDIQVDTLDPQAFVPNAFTPNGDGVNDVFQPYFPNKSGYTVESIRIFDRYGKIVYQAFNTDKAEWNGTYGNNGKPANMGTYFYQMKIKFVDGTQLSLKGSCILIR